jgi:hypothetical protein
MFIWAGGVPPDHAADMQNQPLVMQLLKMKTDVIDQFNGFDFI